MNWSVEIIIIFILILINGALSMAEIALISARKSRLQQFANQGDEKARKALLLSQNPNRFLSTVQIGITLVGVLTSVFGGASIANHINLALKNVPTLAPYSEEISFVLVVLAITYFTLVLGELAPKRLALNTPEAIAKTVSPAMLLLSKLTSPLVRSLTISTDVLLRILRVRPSTDPSVTEEDVKALIQEGTQTGVFEEVEEDMVAGVFRLSDRRVGSLMTPRSDIIWLDVEDSFEENRRKIILYDHSRFPVGRGDLDNFLGIVQAKDLLAKVLNEEPINLLSNLIAPLVIPESTRAFDVLENFKTSRQQIAIVIDEFGVLQGLVTIFDLLEAIVGELPSQGERDEPAIIQREDGSWLIDGKVSIEEFKKTFNITELPEEERGYYQTVAGFVITYLGRIPDAADHFEWSTLRFEIVDMDGFRVDKIIVDQVVEPSTENDPVGR